MRRPRDSVTMTFGPVWDSLVWQLAGRLRAGGCRIRPSATTMAPDCASGRGLDASHAESWPNTGDAGAARGRRLADSAARSLPGGQLPSGLAFQRQHQDQQQDGPTARSERKDWERRRRRNLDSHRPPPGQGILTIHYSHAGSALNRSRMNQARAPRHAMACTRSMCARRTKAG